MNTSKQLALGPMALRRPETGAVMAKADLRKPDTAAYYAALGSCIQDVQHVFGLTLDEFAAEVKKDSRQLKRQIEGQERPQLEVVFAVERFRGPLVIALAKLAAGVEVQTVVTLRRSA